MAEFHSLKDLQDLLPGWEKNVYLNAVLTPDPGREAQDVPYEKYFDRMIRQSKSLDAVIKLNPEFIRRFNYAKRTGKSIFDVQEMNLKNIANSLGKTVEGGLTEEDIKKNNPKYNDINGFTIKSLAEREGWDWHKVLKMIQDAQLKQGRQDIYDENLLVRTMFPRVAKALRDTGDYSRDDMTLDLIENGLQLVPMGGIGTKFATAGARSGLGKSLRGVGGTLIENFTVPTSMALADEFRKDPKDWDWKNVADRAVTGGLVNTAASKMIGTGIQALMMNPAWSAKIANMLDTGDAALRNKLDEIGNVLAQGRSASPEMYKRALNELNMLTKHDAFSNGSANIADYAARNMTAKKVGKNARKTYEKELDDAFSKLKFWAQDVKAKQRTFKDNPTYLTNRETLFPHQFVNTDKLGAQSGLLKVTGSPKVMDKPEFNLYSWDNLPENLVSSKRLGDVAAAHRSKTFQYPIDIDPIINSILQDEQMTKAIMRAYGMASPREAVMNYVTNKLGRSDWLRRQQSALTRVFGDWFSDPNKKKPEEEEE